jgi:hypothetical protein
VRLVSGNGLGVLLPKRVCQGLSSNRKAVYFTHATQKLEPSVGLSVTRSLALQLPFLTISESMGNHDSKIVGAGSVD